MIGWRGEAVSAGPDVCKPEEAVSMPDLAPDLARETRVPDRTATGTAAFRTLLVGPFAEPGCHERAGMERLLADAAANRGHCVLPGCAMDDQVEQAEADLARDCVDIVLLDLHGPVTALLSLLSRLRAAAAETVVFIGILPPDTSERARLYLGAVVDEMLEAPPLARSLHRAIARALDLVSDFQGHMSVSAVAGSPTRH
jgi:hypothetical protein